MKGEHKPYIRCSAGVWSCATFTRLWCESLTSPVISWRIGYGYSREEAVADWEAQA